MNTLEVVQPIIVDTYGKGSMTIALAEHVANEIDTFEPQYPDDTREDMIRLTCWNWMTGGSTAEIVARKIEAALEAAGVSAPSEGDAA
jgi:type IV pilus biogenesis protein CpaD/CtpE